MYEDNLKSFIKWCRDHKTFMDSDIKKTERIENKFYYLEMNKIQIRELSNIPFFGPSLMRFDQNKKDFICVKECDKNRILRDYFLNQIIDFCDSSGIEDKDFDFLRGD